LVDKFQAFYTFFLLNARFQFAMMENSTIPKGISRFFDRALVRFYQIVKILLNERIGFLLFFFGLAPSFH